MKKTYEEEKQDIIKIAEDNFGKEFFEKLVKMAEDFSSGKQKSQGYTLSVNYKGAFYASEN